MAVAHVRHSREHRQEHSAFEDHWRFRGGPCALLAVPGRLNIRHSAFVLTRQVRRGATPAVIGRPPDHSGPHRIALHDESSRAGKPIRCTWLVIRHHPRRLTPASPKSCRKSRRHVWRSSSEEKVSRRSTPRCVMWPATPGSTHRFRRGMMLRIRPNAVRSSFKNPALQADRGGEVGSTLEPGIGRAARARVGTRQPQPRDLGRGPQAARLPDGG